MRSAHSKYYTTTEIPLTFPSVKKRERFGEGNISHTHIYYVHIYTQIIIIWKNYIEIVETFLLFKGQVAE